MRLTLILPNGGRRQTWARWWKVKLALDARPRETIAYILTVDPWDARENAPETGEHTKP